MSERNDRLRQRYLARYNSFRLRNREVSLVSSNCNGAMMLHELGLAFRSPFVNLWIPPADYVRLLQDFRQYMDLPLTFVSDPTVSYPVGMLGDVRIYFQHYKTPEDAGACWQRRKARMDYDRLFFLFSDRDGCTYEDLAAFDRLPYQNKVVFVHLPHPELQSAFYIKGFEKEDQVGACYEFMGPKTGVKYYDQLDYVRWFNGDGVHRLPFH